MRLTAILWLVATLLLPSKALAVSVPDALALVHEYDAGLADTLSSVPVVANNGRCPVGVACTDGVTIWYRPDQIAGRNPLLTERAALAMVLVKEGTHVEQYRAGARFSAANCFPLEVSGHEALIRFYDWLWYGSPSRTVYTTLETAAVSDPFTDAWDTCRLLRF